MMSVVNHLKSLHILLRAHRSYSLKILLSDMFSAAFTHSHIYTALHLRYNHIAGQ
jgi:hypothetical protein